MTEDDVILSAAAIAREGFPKGRESAHDYRMRLARAALAAQQDGARVDREEINAVLVDLIGDDRTPSLLVRSDRMKIADAIVARLHRAEQGQDKP